MKKLTGIYLTDSVSKSGIRFPIETLEEALWQSYGQCVPSNLSHDVHRPLGITQISSLYFSHENVYLLGNTSIPENLEEHKWVMAARTNYLNEKIKERVFQYSQNFHTELSNLGLLKKEGKLMSNGVVMYGYENIALEAFPYLKDNIDNDGLIYLGKILSSFNYKGDGVFASKKNNLSIIVHPYLRRSFSRYNCFNKGFLKELFDSNTESTPVRIRIDLDYVGYTPSFIVTQEFDFWFGPKYTDDISQIKEGVTTYETNQEEYLFNQIKKTEFVWQDKDGKRQFEMEEVTDEEAPTLPEGTYGCRYIHSFYDLNKCEFDHFDGAIRCYDIESICNRLKNPINVMGHSAQYTKVFRIDGALPIHKWKSLITHYLKGNQDVYRYFGESVPYVTNNEQTINPISKYVPFVLKPSDGVRILISYHPLTKLEFERCFMDFDTCNLEEGVVDTTDLMSVELTKCIHRVGGMIDYPPCRYISFHDNFHNLPEIYHSGNNPTNAIEKTLEGIKLLLNGEKENGVEDCFSFCLSWGVEDRKVKISFMGAVPDMLKWITSFNSIPTDRDGLKEWIEIQTQYIKANGRNTPSPMNAPYIHGNGIFYHHRRLVQKDALLKNLHYNENDELCASIEFTDNQKELAELIKLGVISYAAFIVVDKLLCDGDNDYLKYDKIASLGEIDCQPTIHFMNFVWSSRNNDLRDLC